MAQVQDMIGEGAPVLLLLICVPLIRPNQAGCEPCEEAIGILPASILPKLC